MFPTCKKLGWAVLGLCLAGTGMADSFCNQKEVALAGATWLQPAVRATELSGNNTQYNRILILEPTIEFRKNWQRDHRDVSKAEMERISGRLAKLYREVFTEVFASDGYEIANEPAEDVVGLKTAFTDLDVAAPDTRTAGRVKHLAASAGGMTISSDLFDSSDEFVFAQVTDSRRDQFGRRPHVGNYANNSHEARRLMKYWAELVVARLQGSRVTLM